ncbi:hypothetical protein O6H91_17G083900 [Diphasiastrum complanatum]|uniref:Uncharacterized protein n=2 Tax=Diphasiastrum complanatum TaxID=34168 RepID=A0ACC2B8K8_DIPCM|nr:hypothetical protein O6H91_17G083200 [Diphasiastrum complanatum]KAJ7526142.1 hypothetical protein O6H91_17G083900 [Diphasiastrum complanatum]
MQHGGCKHLHFYLLSIWLILVTVPAQASSGESFGLKLIHKYSDEAKTLMKHRNGGNVEHWPSMGSSSFYQILHEHDIARHGRKLSTYDTLIFSEGNETAQLQDQFGGIYYTVVDLGTPFKTFVVALDTGSDLFWVPCQCKKCAPLSAPGYSGLASVMNAYSPAASVTSQPVNCSNNLCDLRSTCKSGIDQCPYTIHYGSSNTSTSGTLVEDVMHFSRGDLSKAPPISVPIIFGCGEVQTGALLQGSSPDGLLGLGRGGISVPGLLATAALVQDSFSMCFGADSSGRIFFGDKGDPAQQTTSFMQLTDPNTYYSIGLEQILVGNQGILWNSAMIFDSGTSFTYFPPTVYQAVTKAFDSQIQLKRMAAASLGLPFEFCYSTSASGKLLIPDFNVSLILNGGAKFSVLNPYVVLVDQNTNKPAALCLAFLSGSPAIIGVNFMIGYRIVFDRQALKLGWLPSDCYNAVGASGPETSPAPSLGPVAISPATSPSSVVPPSSLQPPSSAPSFSHSPSASPSSSSPIASSPIQSSGAPDQISPTTSKPGTPPTTGISSFGARMQPHTFVLAAFSVGLIMLTGF